MKLSNRIYLTTQAARMETALETLAAYRMHLFAEMTSKGSDPRVVSILSTIRNVRNFLTETCALAHISSVSDLYFSFVFEWIDDFDTELLRFRELERQFWALMRELDK